MKAVFILEQGGVDKLIYDELPDPTIEENEVMVRVGGTALNHLDVFARAGLRGVKVKFPRILGCDIAGEVVQVGRNVTRLKPGDRVIFNPNVTCRKCEYCLSGEDNLCSQRKALGVDLDGGYAEYAKAPEENAHKIPDGMSFEEAAAIPLVFMTAWH
ncbi:MAG: alcohol dehydrogenase catalytic domain-containing protein, partial [Chloroflexi bacterium]|nr:alcohol dehydrogenase catalytic domain-containing protein [Chloroflexota bacterium]